MKNTLFPTLTYFVNKECTTDWSIPPQSIYLYSFLFIEEGDVIYSIDNVEYKAKKGDIIFVKPRSSRWAKTDGMKCIGIDFELPDGNDIDLPPLLQFGQIDDLRIHLQDIKYEWLQQNPGYTLKADANLMLILHKLIYEKKSSSKNIHVEMMKNYIIENHKQDISVSVIADIVNLSPVYCGALFKKTENCTIAEFLNRIRINKAMSLLESGEYTISQTALECGFIDIYYFSNSFKKVVGMSPRKYKNSRIN